MSESSQPGKTSGGPAESIASSFHTTGLVLLIVSVSLWASVQSPITEWPVTLGTSRARTLMYVQMPLLPALWIAYIWTGVRRRTSLGSLVNAQGVTVGRFLRYAAIGIGGGIVWIVVSAVLGTNLRATPEQLRGLEAMLPHGASERWVWVACAPAAGIFEEVVYRGYLLRQFTAITHSTIAALVFQAVTYGLAHLILPAPMLLPIALLGLFLGLLTVWQRSLIPAMILHASVALSATAGGG